VLFHRLLVFFVLWNSEETQRKREREREEQWRAASPTLPACQSVCQSGVLGRYLNVQQQVFMLLQTIAGFELCNLAGDGMAKSKI